MTLSRVVPMACLLAGGAWMAGCSGPVSKPAADPGGAAPAALVRPEPPPPAAPVALADVRLGLLDRPALDAFLAQQRGKVVLVDFWATWCVPCVQLFPHTVGLHQRLAGKGLVVVSVSMDDPDQMAQIRKFLAGKGAAFENFIAQPAPDPFAAFEISGGSLPHFKLYGRDGTLRKTIGSESKSLEEKDLDQAVEELLAEAAGAGR